jgi:hypothetical protein
MHQEDINQCLIHAETLYSFAESFEDKADCYMCEVRIEQFRLDSLVHFCNTGKFFGYEQVY